MLLVLAFFVSAAKNLYRFNNIALFLCNEISLSSNELTLYINQQQNITIKINTYHTIIFSLNKFILLFLIKLTK